MTEPEHEDGGWYVVRGIQHDRTGMKPMFGEIVISAVDSIHIERLSGELYWMAIEKGGERLIVTFSSKNMRSHVAGRFELE